MYNAVLQWVPNTWDTSRDRVQVGQFTEEYKQVQFELNEAVSSSTATFNNLTRIQNVYSYGQFLLREQLLAFNGPNQLYRVRRYVKVSRSNMQEGIKYNLDPRRCGLGSLTLSKRLDYLNSNYVIFIVQVLTTEPHSEQITPSNTLEYFIEYVAEC